MPIHDEVEAFQRTSKDQLLAGECTGDFTHLLAKTVTHVERPSLLGRTSSTA